MMPHMQATSVPTAALFDSGEDKATVLPAIGIFVVIPENPMGSW